MEMARNPAAMREMMRSQDRQLSNIEVRREGGVWGGGKESGEEGEESGKEEEVSARDIGGGGGCGTRKREKDGKECVCVCVT